MMLSDEYVGGGHLLMSAAALPDLSAFDHESSIERKKRGQKRLSASAIAGGTGPTAAGTFTPGSSSPAYPASLSSSAAHGRGGYGHGVPSSLSSSHGRAAPVCPSTPMKSPSVARLFHSYQHSSAAAPSHAAFAHTPHAHSLASSLGRGDTSFASSLASSRGSAEHSFAGSDALGLSFGSPQHEGGYLFSPDQHMGSSSPAAASVATERPSKRATHMQPPNSLASSLGRSVVATTHFATAFYNYGEIGRGSFGACFHVADATSGAEYAVKKSLRAFRGENDRAARRKEVENLRTIMAAAAGDDASAAAASEPSPPIPSLDDHRHLVRYYSAWEEAGSLYIQTELLCGGTVRQYLDNEEKEPPCEELLWIFLLDLARGLRFVHERAQLAHLDLKWENTFISTAATGSEPAETGILKIGDFGSSMNLQERASRVHSAQAERAAAAADIAASTPCIAPAASHPDDGEFNDAALGAQLHTSATYVPDIEEGDSIYLAPEFLVPSLLEGGAISGAADIFSLGLMMLEAACDIDLPKHGQDFQDLRSGPSPQRQRLLERCYTMNEPVAKDMRKVIEAMLARRPCDRPSARHLLTHPRLVHLANGGGEQTRAMLRELPSVLPTSQHLRLGRGLLFDSSPLDVSGAGSVSTASVSGGSNVSTPWFAHSVSMGLHEDITMTPISQRSSPMAPLTLTLTGRKRTHAHGQPTPTSLAFALAACTPAAASPMLCDEIEPLPDLSASLFSSASYASSRNGLAVTSVDAAAAAADAEEARVAEAEEAAFQREKAAFERAHLFELSKSTRRTTSSHTQRHQHRLAADLPHTNHGLRFAQKAPAAQPQPGLVPSSSLALVARRTPSPEPEEDSLPARNLFASFQGADDDD